MEPTNDIDWPEQNQGSEHGKSVKKVVIVSWGRGTGLRFEEWVGRTE